MKVIDLLNKIANGEEVPRKIRYDGIDMFWCEPCKIHEVADVKEGELCGKNLYNILDNLNDEVEIIEDEIDKDIKWYFIEEQEAEKTKIAQINMNFKILREKLTEIIDKLNEMEKE